MTQIVFTITLLLGTFNLCFGTETKHPVVEVDLFIDLDILSNFNGRKIFPFDIIAKEHRLLISEGNKYLESMLKYGVKIEVRKRYVDIFQEFKTNNTYLDVDKTIPYLKKFVKEKGPPTDLTIYLTGYPLLRGSKQLRGISLGKVCTGEDALIIITYTGMQATSQMMAQQIARSLGIDYDKKIDGYIMDSNLEPTDKHRWEFSRASAIAAAAAFNNGYDCLKKTTTKKENSVDPKSLYSMLYDRSNVCKRDLQDDSASFCKKPKNKIIDRGDELCQAMYCKRSSSSTCEAAVPTEGMPCGEKPDNFSQICERGKCVPGKS